jgi:DNA polymerase
MLSDYARLLMLRGERTVLLRKEALTALEKLATGKASPGAAAVAGLDKSGASRGAQSFAPDRGVSRSPYPAAAQPVVQAPPSVVREQPPKSVAPAVARTDSGTVAPERPALVVSPTTDARRVATPAGPTAEGRASATPGSGTKAERLEALRKIVAPCILCEHLAASRTQTVYGVGNPDCEIMFVGEAPGADEDKKGEPFVGAAGLLLTKMIGAMKLSRDDVYIANVLKCRPDMPAGASGNRKPTPAEMRTCLPYLKEQISIIKPKVLVALGLTAVEGLRELAPGSITLSKMRGKFTEFEGIPLMPTFHPAYLLRNQSITEKRKAWEDLLQVMEKVGMPIDDRQRNFFLTKS